MFLRFQNARLIAGICLIACSQLSHAEESFRYPEGRHGKGELRYIQGIPVLIVRGSHAEMGEQIGHLALKPAARMLDLVNSYADRKVPQPLRPVMDVAVQAMYAKFPKEYREEVEAMAVAAGVDKEGVVKLNTVMDLLQMIGCSSLLVSQARSKTGGPLYGRNLGVPYIAGFAEFSLLIVHQPERANAFAMPSFPGFLMLGSGMNAKGLALGAQSVGAPKDGSGRFGPAGVPSAVAGRRLMERCSDIDEARAWFEQNRLARCISIAACDRERQSVLEVTTTRVLPRGPTEGICCATNHFCHPELAANPRCPRYAILDESRKMDRLGVAEVASLMKAVNQGKCTVHTMIFEPATLKIHLAMGPGPATDRPLAIIDLAELFDSKPVAD